MVRISGVECLTGQTVRFRIEIRSETGIESYGVWSTWGGGGDINETFSAPLPMEIDETLEFTHAITDPEPGRAHQFGLSAQMLGTTDPLYTYEIEPDSRCPGH